MPRSHSCSSDTSWKGEGGGDLLSSLHSHTLQRPAPAPARESLGSGELDDDACGGWRADPVRFLRWPTDATSDRCLGHQNHLYGNRSWSMGGAPPQFHPYQDRGDPMARQGLPSRGLAWGGEGSLRDGAALCPATVVVFAVCVLLTGKARTVQTGDISGNPAESTELFISQAFDRASCLRGASGHEGL